MWRVFSLVALFITWPLYLKYLWSFYCLRRTLDDKEERVSSASWSKPSDLFFSVMWLICYATARWGSIVLMFISLRALPAGSYTTVDWLSSIPHIWCPWHLFYDVLWWSMFAWLSTPLPFFTLVAKIKAKKRIPMIIIFSPSVWKWVQGYPRDVAMPSSLDSCNQLAIRISKCMRVSQGWAYYDPRLLHISTMSFQDVE